MNVLIISAGESRNLLKLKEYSKKSDYIICADAGYNYAKEAGIVPDILIGDFDSLGDIGDDIKKIQLPCEKDETDTLYALRYALEKGADEVVIYGALGKRLDHTYANMCLLFESQKNGAKTVITDGETVCMMTDSSIRLNGENGTYISVFSFDDISRGVTIKGLKYTLDNYDMKKYDTIGTSNEFIGTEAEISVRKGNLIIICN